MERYPVWIAFLIVFQLTAVLGRNPIHEYFYNKYHHKDHSSTTDAISSSISGDSENIVHTSTGNFEDIKNSSQGVSENVANASTGNFDDIKNSSQDDYDASLTPPTLQHGDEHKHPHMHHRIFLERIALVVGSIMAFLCIIAVIVCCCPHCCQGRSPQQYVRRDEIETASEVHPQQPMLVPYAQQVIIQNFPPHYHQGQVLQLPSQYQPQISQEEYQYSQRYSQFCGLPEAPPPYEPPKP